MQYDIFLIPLLVSFAISMMLQILLILLNKKKRISDVRNDARHIHKIGISRFGGVAIVIGFLAAIFFNKKLFIDQPLFGVLFASLAIMVFGLVDDMRQLNWKRQLFFQASLVVFLYVMGVRLEYVTNPLGGIFLFSGFWGQSFSLFFSMVWIIFIMNAMNWIDGIDGASGGVAFIGALTIFFLSLRPEVNQPPVAIIATAFIGGLGAFLFFNFYPAKIIAGTSGAMFMGFILAILAIFAGAKIATTLLVLAVPIIDAFWVVAQRYKSGHSIFLADKKHLHFRLLELGWSQRVICFFYYIITALVAFIALNTYAIGKFFTFVIVATLMLGVYVFINKRRSDAV